MANNYENKFKKNVEYNRIEIRNKHKVEEIQKIIKIILE